jgi:ATP-dependent Clp protease ATP-binding subunit ClpX
VPTQEAAHATLGHLLSLHQHQVLCAEHDESLVRPPHLWLTGPCGCGKSYLARNAASNSGLPWIRADLSRYAIAGQPGLTLEWIFQELADNTSGPAFTEGDAGVVVLEGIDRELNPAGGERTRALQSELASLLEGRDLPIRIGGRNATANTRRLLFILPFTTTNAGAARRPLGFGGNSPAPVAPAEPGTQPLVDAGVHPSLLNVTSSLLHLPELPLADLGSLLIHADGGLAGTRRLFADEGISLELTHDARDWIARETLALGRGGHGLLQVLSQLAPRLVGTLPTLPQFVATLRITADFLSGRQSSPECIAGIRRPVGNLSRPASRVVAPHPDFPPETLPHRPTRPTNTGASSQGRLANLSDLNRWIQ